MLLVRLAMQAQKADPGLGWLVLELLGDLLGKAVWAHPALWRGWLMAAQSNAPASFPTFLQVGH